MTKKTTKRALVSTVVVLALCFTMLVGTTFAWFTDSATSTGNIIKTGSLDVEMSWADGKEDPAAATYADASTGAIFNYDLWEPGYAVARHIQIKNAGTLALKYTVKIVANGEVSELADVIDVYYADPAVQVTGHDALTADKKIGTLTDVLEGMETSAAGNLLAGDSHNITIVLKMQETAGNEYKNMSLCDGGFSVQILATQYTYEEDSFGPDYDEEAGPTVVSDANELVAALANGGAIELDADVALTDTVNIEKDTVINLNGNDFDASANASRPFNVADGVSLTINATGADVKVGAYGFVNVPAGNNANVTINGGNFTANTNNGSFIKARGTGVINVTLNNVNYTDTSSNGGWIANAVETDTNGNQIVGNFTLNVNGGNYDVYNGFSSVEALTVTGVNLTVKNVGVYNSSGTAVVDNCTITCTNQNTATEQANAPASCVSVSSNLDIVVKNSTLISNSEATAIYTSGGTVVIENCNVTGAYAHYIDNVSYPDAEYKTTVDGVEVTAVVH